MTRLTCLLKHWVDEHASAVSKICLMPCLATNFSCSLACEWDLCLSMGNCERNCVCRGTLVNSCLQTVIASRTQRSLEICCQFCEKSWRQPSSGVCACDILRKSLRQCSGTHWEVGFTWALGPPGQLWASLGLGEPWGSWSSHEPSPSLSYRANFGMCTDGEVLFYLPCMWQEGPLERNWRQDFLSFLLKSHTSLYSSAFLWRQRPP